MSTSSVVDGWYAWLVCVVCFLVLVIQGGLLYSMGVFYIMFQNAIDASDGALSLVTSLNYSFLFLACPFVGMLTDKYNERPLAVFGALIATVGLVCTSFATEVYHLYITYSLLTGIGFGLVYNPSTSIIGKYFEKYMKTAMGLTVCGFGVGSFVLPPIITCLEDEYGWRGALLLVSGIYAHVMIFCCIYRPVPPKPASPKFMFNDSEKKEALSNEAEQRVSSIDVEQKESSDEEEKEELLRNTDQKEPLFKDTEHKQELSRDTKQKKEMFSDMEKKKELLSDTEHKQALSNDMEQKEVSSSNTKLKEGWPSDSEQRVLSNDVEQKKVSCSDVDQKEVLPSNGDLKEDFFKETEQKEVVCIDAEHQEDLSSHSGKKQVSSNDEDLKESFSSGTEEKEIKTSSGDEMNHIQSVACEDTKDSILNHGEEELSENKQYKDLSLHSITNGYSGTRLRKKMKDIISLLRNVPFSCLCLHSMLIHFPTVLVYTHLGQYILTLGYTKGDVVYLYMAIGISSTISRALIGFGAEVSKVNLNILVIGSAIFIGLLTVFVTLFHELTLMYVYAVTFAIMLSPYNAFCFPMVKDCVPKGQDATAHGIVCFFCVPGTAFGAPLGAWLYDMTNLYASSFYLAGILFIVSGLLMIPAMSNRGWCNYGANHHTQQ